VAPFPVDTGATLLTLLTPLPAALGDERTFHPIWALKAMVVACASVGWNLAQPDPIHWRLLSNAHWGV
jgi:hypothetical protein